MPTTPQHDADRENLSALFDGELRGDAAHFALKRLGHDAQWREACGRWQLLGDALRGDAMAAAPRGFADRVGGALADGLAVATTAAAPDAHAMPSRRRWVGGAALAASVAIAALFVTRPFSPADVASPSTPRVAASAQPAASVAGAGAEMVAAVPSTPDPAAQSADVQSPATPAPVLPAAEAGFAAATMAVADASRRTGERRARAQDQGATQLRGATVAAAPAVVASAADAAPSAIEPSPSHPFLPQGEVASRPWPRAVLPDYPAGSAFTAGFDSRAGAQPGSPGSSSFYPFEPRMLGADQSPASMQNDSAADAAPPGASDWPQR